MENKIISKAIETGEIERDEFNSLSIEQQSLIVSASFAYIKSEIKNLEDTITSFHFALFLTKSKMEKYLKILSYFAISNFQLPFIKEEFEVKNTILRLQITRNWIALISFLTFALYKAIYCG